MQFAVMGEIYYRATFGNRKPRVGLLSIGEEESKGNELTSEVNKRLKKAHSALHWQRRRRRSFLWRRRCDRLRWIRGKHRAENLRRPGVQIFGLLRKKSLKSSLVSQFGAMLSQGAFKGLKKTIDYTEYGGAPLLGVRGVCVIGHGRSNANAIKNAIRVAAGLARAHERKNRTGAFSRCCAPTTEFAMRRSSRKRKSKMGKVAFVFPGQASQYPGMGKELAEKYPAAKSCLRRSGQGAGIFHFQNVLRGL